MGLAWSEEQPPCGECPYNHVVADTPIGPVVIDWKGWKEWPGYDIALPWGVHLHADSLEGAKGRAQSAWDNKVNELRDTTGGE